MSFGSEPNSPSNGDFEGSKSFERDLPHDILRIRLREGVEAPPQSSDFGQVQHIIFDDGEDASSSESEDELEEVKDPDPRRPPSIGSLDHGGPAGCRPCAFYLSPTGCRHGIECNFCHMEHAPEERQLPKPSSRPAKGKRDKDKRRIAEINKKYARDEPRRLEELRRFAESQAYAARLLGFEGGYKGGKGGRSSGSTALSSTARAEFHGF